MEDHPSPSRFELLNLLKRLFRREESPATEEIGEMIQEATEAGIITPAAARMIASLLVLRGRTVREVLTPRSEMVAFAIDTPTDTLLAGLVESAHSRFPIYEGDPDHVSGILAVKDLLRLVGEGKGLSGWHKLLRPAFFVPETKGIEELLEEMRNQRFHMAVVVDEYGGIAGLITIEDLLEEIVGEIADEYDEEDDEPRMVPEGQGWRVDARLDVDELLSALEIKLEHPDYETVGGLIYHLLGRMPEVGEKLPFERFEIEIAEMDDRRILQVLIHPVSGE
ncbi:MAG: HlyC/CorC family transporter [Alphaproteobacteria bacterium CG_4_10_14_0_2_um_filter_63_37]|nr:MAG: hypothetical protein AUJ55_03040 [Proteobacteria bacterium CG1_02_64_396]PJA23900.1 MAG: HlyC/CorC family transporter [Alphaproteobacteria bacterium CG_4_10_14_0_2_um_filter_63_37]